MDLPKLSGLLAAAQKAAARFPLSFLSAVIGTSAACWAIDCRDDSVEKFCIRIVMAAAVGLALFTALSLFSEKNGHDSSKKWLFQGFGLLVVGGLWATFQLESGWAGEKTAMRFALWLLISHLLVSFAAFTKKSDRVEDFWEFNKQLFSVFVVGALYSVVIFGGLAIAFAATDALFEAVKIRGEQYLRLFYIVAGIFQTIYVLSNVPRDFDFSSDEIRFDRAVVNLVKFILIPIVGLYFVILYAYSAKIVGLWSLPKGWVTGLVIGFSASGIFTWLMNFFLPRIEPSAVLAFFKKWFWAVLAPMLGLLFLAVGRRLADYGVTEPRFVGATAGVWLGAMAAYFLLSKSKDLRALPMSMAVFAGLCLLPFLGMFDATERSQTSQLRQILTKNSLFDGQKLIKKEKLVGGEDATRAADIVHFLRQRDALDGLKKWMPEAADSLFQPAKKNYYGWEESNALVRLLGFDQTIAASDQHRNFHVGRVSASPITITGFDEIMHVNFYTVATIEPSSYEERGRLDASGQKLLLKNEKNEETAYDLQPFLQKIWAASIDGAAIKNGENVVDIDSKTRIIFEHGNLDRDSTAIRAQNLYGWLLVKK